MTKIITENFKTETTHSLYDSLALHNYYVMASASLTDPEFEVKPTITNTEKAKRDFQRKVVFANRVTQDSARYMFFENPWLRGTVYDQYDDTRDIEELNMYVTLQEDGDTSPYIVLKCLDNNNGATSEEIPGAVDAKNYRVVQTQDGYVWQYMFSIPKSQVEQYRTPTSLPLPLYPDDGGGYGDPDVVRNARENISRIDIESTPIGQFNQYLFGLATTEGNASDVQSIDSRETATTGVRQVTLTTTSVTGRSLYTETNAYKNMYLRHPSGKLYDVLGSETEQNNLQLTVRTGDTNDSFTPSAESGPVQCQLVIKILVSNSERGKAVPNDQQTVPEEFDCKAYGVLNTEGTLTKIGFERRGQRYKFATARVVYPPFLKTSVKASGQETILRAVVSPKGGHGSDPISELAMSRLSVVTNFSGQFLETPDANTYSIVGLVKDPVLLDEDGASTTPADGTASHRVDNRLKITIRGDTSGAIVANNYIEQYIKIIDIRLAQALVSYTITDSGNMTSSDFIALGASDNEVGTVFTPTQAQLDLIDASKYAKVSHVTDKVDTEAPEYSYDLEIITARVHQVHNYLQNVDVPGDTDGLGSTEISFVDYYGDFASKFQKGIFYIKEKESDLLSINNKIAEIISYGEYQPYTGDLLHFIDFSPITREAEKTEKIKFTFDF